MKILSETQINFIDSILLKSQHSILTQKDEKIIYEKLGLTRMMVKHRAFKQGIQYEFGYSYDELNKETPGKAKVSLICEVCGCEYITSNAKLLSRTYSNKPLCPTHYREVINNSPEWREKNRKAQLIAQNRKETKDKQIISQKRRHAKPEVKKKYVEIAKELWKDESYRKKVSNGLKKKWEDKEYAEKVLNNSKNQYHGYYHDLRYQSLVELSFILWCKNKNYKIQRYDIDPIKYGNNKNYYPDFIINGDTIVEVKGSPDGFMYQRKKQIIIKQKALQEFCKTSIYKERIVYKKDIPNEFYKLARKIHAEISKKKLS